METQQEMKVDVSQDFNTSVENLFQAWTQEDQLKQWWKPMNNTLEKVNNELQSGGKVDYQFEGNRLHIFGDYSEVTPNELLKYSWNWEFPEDEVKNSAYQLEIRFSGEGERSKIHVLQTAFKQEESLLPHESGWKEGLASLKSYLESK